ncbi:hypothetical protein LAC02_48770 [Ligilactobacillus acidipiscis]|nr:hypothetical protein LAC02_48770 [Ligilactobacillus acidipiscis]
MDDKNLKKIYGLSFGMVSGLFYTFGYKCMVVYRGRRENILFDSFTRTPFFFMICDGAFKFKKATSQISMLMVH